MTEGFIRLENNIVEMLREQQLKLGYMKERVRLYYPVGSLAGFWEDFDMQSMSGLDEAVNKMRERLKAFADFERDRIGDIDIDFSGDRFCISCSGQVAEYVHNNPGESLFLKELIEMVRSHGTKMEDVIALFGKYSNNVVINKGISDEFDYLVYFEDGKPDSFFYLLTDEGEHVTYHRFTEGDFHDLYDQTEGK